MFDKSWEKDIYKKKKQFNNFPFDWVVSSVNRYITSKKNCVELGSGTGNNLDFLLKFGFNKIYSIEAARSAYQFQKKKFLTKKKIKLFCKDLNSFQFKKEYYDLVLDRGTLTHNKLSNIYKMFSKIEKSLTKNGYFLSVLFSSKSSYKTKEKDSYAFKKLNNENGLLTNFFY